MVHAHTTVLLLLLAAPAFGQVIERKVRYDLDRITIEKGPPWEPMEELDRSGDPLCRPRTVYSI